MGKEYVVRLTFYEDCSPQDAQRLLEQSAWPEVIQKAQVLRVVEPCGYCNGTGVGVYGRDACTFCHGSGKDINEV